MPDNISNPVPLPGPKERFFQYFQLEATALQQQMGQLEDRSTIGGERRDAIDHCLAGIARLQKEVQDAASYTTAYDQRMYSEGIKALHEKLDETRAALAPKSKFTFKSTIKKNNSAISLTDAAELAMQQRAKLPGYQKNPTSSEDSSVVATPANEATPPNGTSEKPSEPLRRGSLGSFLKAAGVKGTEPRTADRQSGNVRKMSFAQSKSVDISSHADIHIILPSSAAHATSSGSLTNLRHCIVDMSVPTSTGQPFAGLTIKSVRQSLLLCGNVSGAAHITDVHDSVILVTTRQFRMHQCRNCIVYLHVNSRPIIEDCAEIRFAPLPTEYLHFTNNMSAANQWNQVQDFKWLKAERSPNWSVLPAEDVVPDEVWSQVVPGGPSRSLDDILREVGVHRLAGVEAQGS